MNFIRAVKLATPFVKSPAWLSTLLLPEPKPVIVPSAGFEVRATILVEALNAVIVFPPESLAVKVFTPVKAVPLI